MAGKKNVVERQVVEIGFDVDDSGLKNITSGLNYTKSQTEKAYEKMRGSVESFSVSVKNTGSVFDSGAAQARKYSDSISKAGNSVSDFNDSLSKSLTAQLDEQGLIESSSAAYAKLDDELKSSVDIYDSLSDTIDTANDKMLKYAQSGELSAESLDLLERHSDTAERALKDLETEQINADKAVESFKQMTGETGHTVDEVRASEEQMTKALYDLTKAENTARQAAADYNDAIDDFDTGNEKGAKSISDLESLLVSAGITAGLAKIEQGFLECSHAASEFESALAKVSTIADTSQKSMDSIGSDIMKLSRETGQGVSKLSEATYQAISASVDTAGAVSFVEKASRLSMAGFTEQATAADVLTTAINAYKLEIEDTEKISDMLITTQNLGKTSVDELASSMGKVIPLAAAYNVEMDNLSTGYAVLTKGGIATAEATTYLKSMMGELGDSSKTVAKILAEETGQTFSQLMGSGKSLGDVLEILGDSVNGDTTAFNNLWGSQEAGIGALALYNTGAAEFNGTLGKMRNSAGATSAAYDKLAGTTAFAEQKMQNSFENLKISVGNSLNPVMSKLYGTVGDITDSFAEFAEEHPAVTAALAGTTAALGLAAGAVAAYTAVTKIADVVTKTFDKTLSASKIGMIVGVVAAAGAGIGLLANAFSGGKDSVEAYNGTLEECQNEIDATQQKYDAVVASFGEQDEAAKQLKSDLELLNKQYEKGGGAAADYVQRAEKSAKAIYDFDNSFRSSIKDIDDDWIGAKIAVAQLQSVSDKAVKTSADLEYMNSVAENLNQKYQMDISVDFTTGDVSGLDNVVDVLTSKMDEKRKEAALEGISDHKAAAEYAKAWQNRKDVLEKINELEADPIGGSVRNMELTQYQIAYEELTESINEYEGSVQEMFRDAKLSGEDALSFLKSARGETEETFLSLEEAFKELSESADLIDQENGIKAADQVMEDYVQSILKVAEAYDTAYKSALESFQGQFGLFEQASTESDAYLNATVENAKNAIDSQLKYWNTYGENISFLASTSAEQLGITQANYDALMEKVRSGDEQAAGLAASITEHIKAGNTEVVANLANTIGEVSSKQEEIAKITAQWSSGLDEAMKDTYDDMRKAVKKLDLSDEAQKSAESTMNSYIHEIIEARNIAVREAKSMVDEVKAVFDSNDISYEIKSSVTSDTSKLAGANASGTLSAPRGFNLVGEEGPEIVWLNGGERVFNNSETTDILNALNKPRENVSVYIPKTAEEAMNYTPEKDAASTVINNNNDNSTSNVNHNNSYNFESHFEFNGVSTNDQRRLKQFIKEAFKEMLEESSSGQEVIER